MLVAVATVAIEYVYQIAIFPSQRYCLDIVLKRNVLNVYSKSGFDGAYSTLRSPPYRYRLSNFAHRQVGNPCGRKLESIG